jgi:hypothetical protein
LPQSKSKKPHVSCTSYLENYQKLLLLHSTYLNALFCLIPLDNNKVAKLYSRILLKTEKLLEFIQLSVALVDNELYKRILYLHYFRGLSTHEIAGTIYYSHRQIKRYKRQALIYYKDSYQWLVPFEDIF